ncbi:MAG: HEAT repeat domain-containing protein [Planctomycetota bacterium]|nr:HEAT repeat domain-containing protein [Planctomycetota bacterium]
MRVGCRFAGPGWRVGGRVAAALILVVAPSCASGSGRRSTAEKEKAVEDSVRLVGVVIEIRERASGVVATIQAERVLRGDLYRSEVEALLGQEWWRLPVREGGTYTFLLEARSRGAPHSFMTAAWPDGVLPAPAGDRELAPPPPRADPDRLSVLLMRIRSGAITRHVERAFVREGPGGVPGLIQALEDGDLITKWNAARLLALLPSSQATAPLASLTKSEDPKLRIAAISALTEIRTLESLQALEGCLRDEDPAVRRLAVDGIGRHRSVESLAPVLSLLEDPGKRIRIAAARAAGRIGGEEAAIALAAFLEKGIEDEELLLEVIDSLGRAGGAFAREPLEKVMNAGESGLVREASDALARLGRIGVPVFLRGLSSEDRYVRWRSAAAMRSITGRRFGYDPDAPTEAREEAARRWQAWWKESG